MSHLTELRHALLAVVRELPGRWQVHTGVTDFSEDGVSHQRFTVSCFAGQPDEDTEELLDELLEASGVKRELEADRHLGGLAIDTRVVRASGVLKMPGDQLGAEWTIETLLEGG